MFFVLLFFPAKFDRLAVYSEGFPWLRQYVHGITCTESQLTTSTLSSEMFPGDQKETWLFKWRLGFLSKLA